MKTNIKIYCILFALALLVACQSDDDTSSGNTAEIAQIEAAVEDGSWGISSYVEDGVNETSDFAGYTFNFMSNGTVTATLNAEVVQGSWSVTDSSSSSSSDDDDDVDFNLSFPVPDTSVLDELNDDWDVISYTATQLVLKDISGGNGGVDDLVFSKN